MSMLKGVCITTRTVHIIVITVITFTRMARSVIASYHSGFNIGFTADTRRCRSNDLIEVDWYEYVLNITPLLDIMSKIC